MVKDHLEGSLRFDKLVSTTQRGRGRVEGKGEEGEGKGEGGRYLNGHELLLGGQ